MRRVRGVRDADRKIASSDRIVAGSNEEIVFKKCFLEGKKYQEAADDLVSR